MLSRTLSIGNPSTNWSRPHRSVAYSHRLSWLTDLSPVGRGTPPPQTARPHFPASAPSAPRSSRLQRSASPPPYFFTPEHFCFPPVLRGLDKTLERGLSLSTIQHCLEWYKLILRTRLPTPAVQYLVGY